MERTSRLRGTSGFLRAALMPMMTMAPAMMKRTPAKSI